MKKEDLDELLNVDHAARLLGTNAGNLNNMRMRGIGPCYLKLVTGARGGAVRYRRRDLLEWLQKNSRVVEPKRDRYAARHTVATVE